MKKSQNTRIIEVIKGKVVLNCRQISKRTGIEISSCARSLNELSLEPAKVEVLCKTNCPITDKIVKYYILKNGQNNTPERLPMTFKNGNFTNRQIKRGEKAVIYEQVTSYEVFEIKIQKAKRVKLGKNDVEFKHKEKLPTIADFGTTAWSYNDPRKAINKFNEIEK